MKTARIGDWVDDPRINCGSGHVVAVREGSVLYRDERRHGDGRLHEVSTSVAVITPAFHPLEWLGRVLEKALEGVSNMWKMMGG